MSRGIPNQPRKKATKKAPAKKVVKKVTKKTTKKVTKPAYTRKPKIVDVKVETAAEPSENCATDAGAAMHETLHQAFMYAIGLGERGQFGTSGLLDIYVRDRVGDARGNVVEAVRGMIEAAIAMNAGAIRSVSERDVLTARQRLAVAEFELAMDGLETSIRG